jgi:hypothetical protein
MCNLTRASDHGRGRIVDSSALFAVAGWRAAGIRCCTSSSLAEKDNVGTTGIQDGKERGGGVLPGVRTGYTAAERGGTTDNADGTADRTMGITGIQEAGNAA